MRLYYLYCLIFDLIYTYFRMYTSIYGILIFVYMFVTCKAKTTYLLAGITSHVLMMIIKRNAFILSVGLRCIV